MIIEGNAKRFLVINTVEYNNDGCWCVQDASANLSELNGLGFDGADVERIWELGVGDMLSDFDFQGVIVIRVA